jgi:hypothetical protein
MRNHAKSETEKSIRDVATPITFASKEFQVNILSKEDNGNRLWAPYRRASCGFAFPRRLCNCLVICKYTG